MNQKITRRRLAAAALLPAAALRAAQTQPAGPPEDLNTTAQEQLRKNSRSAGQSHAAHVHRARISVQSMMAEFTDDIFFATIAELNAKLTSQGILGV